MHAVSAVQFPDSHCTGQVAHSMYILTARFIFLPARCMLPSVSCTVQPHVFV